MSRRTGSRPKSQGAERRFLYFFMATDLRAKHAPNMSERFWFRVLPCFVRWCFFIPRFEIGRVKERIYNTRYTLVPTWIARWFGKHAVFLHHFQSDDATQDFHNHPYGPSHAHVLAGGYFEERAFFVRDAGGLRLRPSLTRFLGASWLKIDAGTRNTIFPHTFHRVELIDKKRGCWTLFVADKKCQPWGFWNRNTGEFRTWSGKVPGLPPPEFYDEGGGPSGGAA